MGVSPDIPMTRLTKTQKGRVAQKDNHYRRKLISEMESRLKICVVLDKLKLEETEEILVNVITAWKNVMER